MARGFVKKRGEVYYAYWREDGRQRAKAVSTNMKEADRYLNQKMSQMNSEDWREPKKAKFKDFAEKYTQLVAEPEYKPSTLTNYLYTLESRLLPEFGHLMLHDISPERIQRFVATWLGEDKSPATVRKYVMTLRAILRRAVEWGYLRRNPAEGISVNGEVKGKLRYLTPEQVRKFIEATPEEHKALFQTLVMTGMRLGEALALKESDIDWGANTISIERTLSGGTAVQPKTVNSTRRIAISPHLRSVLREHLDARQSQETEYVFTTQSGSLLHPANLRNRVFKPTLKRAGLPPIRIHDLRHTFATLLINQGENMKMVQSQMGHGSIRVTVDTYGHLLPDTAARAMQNLDAAIYADTPETERVNATSQPTF